MKKKPLINKLVHPWLRRVLGITKPKPFVAPRPLNSECLRDAKVFASRDDLISSLSYRNFNRIAEIGVAWGDFSLVLIDRLKPREFHAFDLFHLHEASSFWGRKPNDTLQGKTHQEYIEEKLRISDVRIFKGDSSELLKSVCDKHYDLIYIDGAHDYDGVLADTTEAIRTVTDNGILVFNDYTIYDYASKEEYGVVHVVNDLCVNGGWKITGFALNNMMFCDVMLTR